MVKSTVFTSYGTDRLKQYENKQGGIEQKNSAHLIELIGATAIIDFVNKPDGNFASKGQTQYFDFGIKKEDQVIDIRHFYPNTAKTVMEPLTLADVRNENLSGNNSGNA